MKLLYNAAFKDILHGKKRNHIIIQPVCWNDNEVHLCKFCTLWRAQQNDRKWEFRLFSVLRYVKQTFSFWGFWNICFQFVSFDCFRFRGVLIISSLHFESRFSRRRLWCLFRVIPQYDKDIQDEGVVVATTPSSYNYLLYRYLLLDILFICIHIVHCHYVKYWRFWIHDTKLQHFCGSWNKHLIFCQKSINESKRQFLAFLIHLSQSK